MKDAAPGASEARYRTIFDSVDDAIFIHDPDTGGILDVNKKMTEMFGYTEDEARTLTVGDISSGELPYDQEEAVERVRASVKQGGLMFEWHCKNKSGHLFWVEVCLKPAVIDGRTFVVATVRDIPKRKQAEENLKESESRYHSLFENNHAAMLLINPDTGRIIDANPAAVSYYGYSREQITSMNITEINTLTGEQVIQRMKLARTQQQRLFTFRHRLASGEVRDVEVYSGPIVVSGETLLYSIVHDVTERKRAEEELKEERARLAATLESMPEEVWIADKDMRLTLVNRAAKENLGENAGIGQQIEKAVTRYEVYRIDGTPRPPGEAPLLRALHGEAVRDREEIVRTPATGEIRHRLVSASPVTDSHGSIIGSVSVVRDITESKRLEESLRQSEQRFRRLADAMPQLVWTAEPDGRVDYYNERYKDYRGISRTPGGYFEWGPVLHEDDVQPTVDAWNRSLKTGEVYQIEHRLQMADGTYQCHLSRGLPVRDEKGRIVKWFGTATNIDMVKQAEEKVRRINAELEQKIHDRTVTLARTVGRLEEQREVLQTVIDNIPVMLAFYNSKGKMSLVSRELERVLGWSEEELLNMDFMAAVYPDPEYRRQVWEYMMEARPGWKDLEMTTKSGARVFGSWSNVKLSDGSQIGIGIDLSERRKMEQDMRRLAKAIEQSGEGIIVLNPEGIIEYANPAYESLSGYSREELLGRQINTLTEYLQGNDFEEIISSVRNHSEEWSGRRKRKNRATGEVFDVSLSVMPVIDQEGKVTNYIIVARNISREVRLQDQLAQTQKMEAIGSLAGGIAHDLKNILTPILINTEMALEDVGESSPARPALEEALNAAKLGRDLVQQILTFSRRAPKKKAPVNIPAVIRDTLGFLRSTLPSSITIHSEIGDECVMAYADPTQIKQVLINLGANAGHAMRDQGGTLEVSESKKILDEDEVARLSQDLAPGPYIQVEVQDTGQGMDEETIEHIFEPFFTTKKGEGTGMGLAVVHGIVKEHQGAVTVRSIPGEGSTFTVLLPVLQDDSEEGLSESPGE